MTPLPPRVLRARMQLMLQHPYLASALARLPVINAAHLEWCHTMATDGYYIYVNPDFCANLSEAEITAVFAHEVLHCALGHIDRRGDRERQLWNMAIDYATNLVLQSFGFQLPRGALLDGKYHALTAEQIYDRLVQEGVKPCQGFDRHILLGDPEGSSQRASEFPSESERRRMRGMVVRELASEQTRRGQGSAPGELTRGIDLATRTTVPWQALLARFFSDLRRSDYRMFPFNKKHLWRGIYLPSSGVPGPDHIVLAVDTSGSVRSSELGQFVAELDHLRALTDCRLTLLHCDAAIQRVDETTGRGTTVLPAGRKLAGGGGTDFRPVFDWVAQRGQQGEGRPDAVIYCTDGYGVFPPQAPDYPVVWVVTAAGAQQYPFGQVIRLE